MSSSIKLWKRNTTTPGTEIRNEKYPFYNNLLCDYALNILLSLLCRSLDIPGIGRGRKSILKSKKQLLPVWIPLALADDGSHLLDFPFCVCMMFCFLCSEEFSCVSADCSRLWLFPSFQCVSIVCAIQKCKKFIILILGNFQHYLNNYNLCVKSLGSQL